MVSRSARFDGLVLDAVERLERRWPQLAEVDVLVEEVPPPDADAWTDDAVPLGRSEPGRREEPPRIVVYRRPVEARAEGRTELGLLVHDVVVEEVAELLGLAPESVDPSYGER